MKYLLFLVAGFFLSAIAHAQGCVANYIEPSFQLQKADPTCSPNSGSVTVVNPQDGAPPYTYKLIETGATNSTGTFTGLAAGTYTVELKDACNTVRTRQVTLVPYQFSFLFSVNVVPGGCNRANISFTVTPSGTYQYGLLFKGRPDTAWFGSSNFTVDSITRSLGLVVKDACGNVQLKTWNAPAAVLPYIGALQYRLQCDKVDIFPVFYGFEAPTVCLYDFDTKALIACKQAPPGLYTSGALTNFFDIPYGKDYYVIVKDGCNRDSAYFPDMTSSGGSELNPYNWDCNSFTMHVDGLEDTVCLYNAATNQLISCKGQDTVSINPRTGLPWPSGAVWENLPYGCYYAWIYDPCEKKTFKIDSCVRYPFGFRSNIAGHCSVTQTAVQANFDPGAKGPYNVKVFYPDGTLAANSTSFNTYSYILYNTWPQPGNIKVVASDACGRADTGYIYQEAVYPSKTVEVRGGCPGIYGLSGGGDIILKGNHAAYGTATVTIIKRDGTDTLVTKSYSTYNAGSDQDEFFFTNLPTGVYIVESSVGCFGMKFYDTVLIKPYAYPVQLSPHIAQCALNPYTFRDTTVNGVAPFTYEVLSTQPYLASLLTGPQPTNVFTIPAGSSLDSITIKVVDACGNSQTKTFPVSRMSDCNILSVEPEKSKEKVGDRFVSVFPNPSNRQFTISISRKKKSNYRVEIFNTSGIKVFQRVLNNVDKREVIVNERLIPGFYIVNVADLENGQSSTFKQIIN